MLVALNRVDVLVPDACVDLQLCVAWSNFRNRFSRSDHSARRIKLEIDHVARCLCRHDPLHGSVLELVKKSDPQEYEIVTTRGITWLLSSVAKYENLFSDGNSCGAMPSYFR